ncbi:outer membrane beta-barrel protein [Gynuella sunshinyii]|uniref:Opacity protein-related surface antigen n=1 Tax=Gynuella sunshinyii YC6258 TaxID=1445510 RepID=A0A0C5VGS8_9GAMM|nr:outer membrane beta-barrel protein [Gynuella sunshinyii]AJQ92583.1 opacity protein-related surface antigen [Gynuella sunshinyii YC6258]
MKKLILLSAASLFASSSAFSYEPLSFDVSINPGIFSYSHSSTEDTDTQTSLRYTLGGYYRFQENYRAGLNLSYFNDHFAGDDEVIHEDVSSFDFAALAQARIPKVQWFDLWLGGGLAYGISDFTDRYTETPLGNVDDTFKDNTGIGDFGYQLQADGVYHLPDSWPVDLGLAATYRAPFENGATVMSIGFKVVFKKTSFLLPGSTPKTTTPAQVAPKAEATGEAVPQNSAEEVTTQPTAIDSATEQPSVTQPTEDSVTPKEAETTDSAETETAADKKAERKKWKNATEIVPDQVYP